MAKKVAKVKRMEETLWDMANKLRGSVEPSEYKHVVLSLIFLKYASDRFTERYNELMAEGKKIFVDNEYILGKFAIAEGEVKFLYLSQWGEPFEKKIIQFSPEMITNMAQNFHNWQHEGYEKTYHDEPEYCYSATLDEIADKNYSLLPSKFIEFKNRDELVDFDTMINFYKMSYLNC